MTEVQNFISSKLKEAQEDLKKYPLALYPLFMALNPDSQFLKERFLSQLV